MLHRVEMDLYKQGFSIDELNCLDIPLAGACSILSYDYYYYYGLIVSIMTNWGSMDSISWDGWEFERQALNIMKLGLEAYEIKSEEDFYAAVEMFLKEKIPFVVPVKYNKIFYNRYYENSNGELYHYYLITEYNTDTNVMVARDSSYFRGMEILNTDSDILFPVPLKREMLWEIFERSNPKKQFLRIKKQDLDFNITKHDIIQYALNSYKNENQILKSIIGDQQLLNNSFKNFEVFNRKFYGSVKAILRVLKLWFHEENANQEELISLEAECRDCRRMIILGLYKAVLANKEISVQQREEYIKQIEKSDALLMEALEKFDAQYLQKNEVCKEIDLEAFYNNRAFEYEDINSFDADISGNGIFFYDSVARKLPLINNTIPFCANILNQNKGFDNISCTGQEIVIPAGKYTKMVILACSEYGSYKEVIKLCKNHEVVQEADFHVSDFYAPPIYNEKVFYSGDTYQRGNGKVEKLDFASRIFSYMILMDNNEIDSIILPNRRNIHIFSCTLIC